jgi:hypothetical protein
MSKYHPEKPGSDRSDKERKGDKSYIDRHGDKKGTEGSGWKAPQRIERDRDKKHSEED